MTALVVAGFHRSGTSMVTDMLARAGLHVGDDLLGAMPSNPYGHYEDRQFVELHDKLLRDAGQTWHITSPFVPSISPRAWKQMTQLVDERQAKHPVWGFKDPRVCFYLGAWDYLVPGMKTLIVYRDPRACVRSLERRHALNLMDEEGPVHLHRLFWEHPDHGLRMWLEYNRALVDFAQVHRSRTLVLSHQAILDGLQVIDSVNNALGFALKRVDNREVLDPQLVAGVTERFPVSSAGVADDVLETWENLQDLAQADLERCHGGTRAVS